MADERIEAAIEHITYTKGVVGTVVCDREGNPIRDSFQSLDRRQATALAAMAAELATVAAPLANLTPGKGKSASKEKEKEKDGGKDSGEIELIRVQTLNHEIVVQCHQEFLLVVVQEPVV